MAGAGRAAAGKAACRGSKRPPGKPSAAPRPGKRSAEKKKVDSRPQSRDEQEIPFRLREIMRSRQEMRNPLSNKKRRREAQAAFRKTLEKEAKGEEPDIPVPKFKQRKRESDGAYVQRMEQEAQHVLFLTKNQATRQPEVQAAPRKKSERKKAFRQRRLDKARQRREAEAADRREQELLQDTVQFGEVVLQPPELTAKPRRSGSREQVSGAGSSTWQHLPWALPSLLPAQLTLAFLFPQPGKKSLVLRTLLSPAPCPPPHSSLARQRIIGEERARAVQAYRLLKQQRRWPQ
ncbi:coiled-coil domain-containing protein 137 isoform X1 [Ochotona curzoniae]|uniref:coiled-coil domain-containing protein 137 isoform X1 n=1 Tax=Ochotona curzoniae TaxID=130825 RepID=UPI001B34E615|nr:coiled-coil domain-containing protein 137 isoform X1 [Ochotona curzoniae]